MVGHYRTQTHPWIWYAPSSRRSSCSAPRPGFGSIRVSVTLGGSTWLTSIFPDSKSGTFLLPVKGSIRARERVAPGDVVGVSRKLLE
ncbi:DUF1905 domain-containing protein [Marisediminicola antarctica]|nr:DUF1905 domain-containing protein [Marisediminicola antarctica]